MWTPFLRVRIMNSAMLWLALVVFAWGVVAYGLTTGVLPNKSNWIHKSDSPGGFWICMAAWVSMASYSLYRLITY